MKSYNEVKCRKGMFEEVLEAICYRASVSGEKQDAGRERQHGLQGLEARSKELLDEFPGRDLSKIDVVAMMVDGISRPRIAVWWWRWSSTLTATNTCWISKRIAVKTRRW